jgi:hypothetical protein
MVAFELLQNRLGKWAARSAVLQELPEPGFHRRSARLWPEQGLTLLGWQLTRFEAGAEFMYFF